MRTRVLALAAVAVMALTACGDDDDALSEEDFLEQGNAICDEGNEELDAAFEELGDAEPTEEQMEDVAQQVADNVEGQIEDLRALEPPEELADDVDAALDDAQEVVEEFRDQGAAIFQSVEDPFADVSPKLAEIGLTSCAN